MQIVVSVLYVDALGFCSKHTKDGGPDQQTHIVSKLRLQNAIADTESAQMGRH